ncbi:YbaB/EbfC family nucleoid-associated protein [Patescibacteria group bacterium]|nr:YbaB/EbfC family nucleoid-associated protein [Patescibacteria group bacterium]
MFNKIKEIKGMRDKAKQIKDMLGDESVHAEASHGQVTMVMDGNMEILSLNINPAMLTADKKESLEQAIKDVTNDAIKKAQRVMAQKIQSMGGMDLPGM